jgi:hypothetical protein
MDASLPKQIKPAAPVWIWAEPWTNNSLRGVRFYSVRESGSPRVGIAPADFLVRARPEDAQAQPVIAPRILAGALPSLSAEVSGHDVRCARHSDTRLRQAAYREPVQKNPGS